VAMSDAVDLGEVARQTDMKRLLIPRALFFLCFPCPIRDKRRRFGFIAHPLRASPRSSNPRQFAAVPLRLAEGHRSSDPAARGVKDRGAFNCHNGSSLERVAAAGIGQTHRVSPGACRKAAEVSWLENFAWQVGIFLSQPAVA